MLKLGKNSHGFTIIELLVVAAILSVLASAVFAGIDIARQQARDSQRLTDIQRVTTALELFFNDHGRYPGNAVEGISNKGEMIGDNDGPIEQALRPYLLVTPKDPRHDGSVYFYSYDPIHCTDVVPEDCDCDGPKGAVLAFNKAETTSIDLQKDVCSGGDMNQHNADYNIVFLPAPD